MKNSEFLLPVFGRFSHGKLIIFQLCLLFNQDRFYNLILFEVFLIIFVGT